MSTVLFFHHATSLGGAPKSLALLIESLRDTEFRAVVALRQTEDNFAVKSIFEEAGAMIIEDRRIRPFHGSTVVPFASYREKSYALIGLPMFVAAARDIIRQTSPAIVHLNSTSMVGAGMAAKMLASPPPILAHVREPILENRWGRLLAYMNRLNVDHFIAIDDEGLRSVGVTANGERGQVIRNGVSEVYFDDRSYLNRSEVRLNLNLEPHDVMFLILSRIDPANGILEFVSTVVDIEQRLPSQVKFVIAGFSHDEGISSYEHSVMDRIAASRTIKACRYTSDVKPLLAACDVLVAPFRTPHSARSVFEAAAAGKPALVSDLPNLKEQIVEGVTGLSISGKGGGEIVQLVEALCDTQKRLQMGIKAREHALKNYSALRNNARVLEFYRELVDGRKS